MFPRLYLDVDPRTLRLPTTRLDGVDLLKYQLQVARFGTSMRGMPPPECYRGVDGEIMINDGVTRATRIANLLPGTLIRIEIIEDTRFTYSHLPTVGDRLP